MGNIVSADKIVNQSMYARGAVDAFRNINDAKPFKTFINGGFIGNVYSYVVRSDGKIFWMFIDPAKFPSGTYFVEHNENKLNVPNLNNILAEIKREQDRKQAEDKGIIQYNIDKYLPYIIGAGVLAIAAPSIISAISNKKVSGMANKKSSKQTVLLLAAGAVAVYLFNKKKRKAGTPIIESIDEGFVNEVQSTGQPTSTTTPEGVSITPVTIVDSFGNKNTIPAIQAVEMVPKYGSGGGGGYIDYLGPFKAVYEQQPNVIAGTGGKETLAGLKLVNHKINLIA